MAQKDDALRKNLKNFIEDSISKSNMSSLKSFMKLWKERVCSHPSKSVLQVAYIFCDYYYILFDA